MATLSRANPLPEMITVIPPIFAPIDSQTLQAPKEQHLAARPCPICGKENSAPIFGLPDFQFFNDDPQRFKRADIQHVSCKNCLALYMNPTYTTEGFAVLFSLAAQSYGASVIRQDEQLAWLHARELLDEGLTFLDVGCYTGNFIAGLPTNIAAVGVDIDQGAIAQAQERHGSSNRRFLAADFEQLSLEENVDVITMFHVLEHLPRPLLVLQKLRALAAAHTRLVLEVPILELAKTNDINGFLTVSHLTHFSRATLGRLALAAGWEIVDETLQPDYNGYRIVAKPGQPQEQPCFPGDRVCLYDYLGHFYNSLTDAAKVLAAIPAASQYVIWGGGFHTELVYHLSDFFREPDRRFLIVDMDPKKQGQHWRGVAITHPDVLSTLDWTKTELLVSSYGNQDAIYQDALERRVPAAKIHRIYSHIRRY